MNVNMSKIKDGLKTACVIAVPILVKMLNDSSARNELNRMIYLNLKRIGYDDAFKAIMDSSMFASDKRKAVSILKNDVDQSYYKAVIETVESSMFASDKIQTIEIINEKY